MRRTPNKPLTVRVSRDVLTIEIGINTLATAALCSDYAFNLMGPSHDRPDARFSIRNKAAFARDVAHELRDELGEDGSTLVTKAIDDACVAAIEQGSAEFIDSEDGAK